MPRPGEKCIADSGLFFERLAEPGAGVLPVPVCNRPRHSQRRSRLFHLQPAEQVQLRDLSGGRVFRLEPAEEVVQRQD